MSYASLLALVLLPLCPVQDAGWPQFLGPDRNGVVADGSWSANGAEQPLWTTNVGLGYSCPSIVGDRLVTMGYDPEAMVDHVVCLQRWTGEELWRHSYEATDEPEYHGGGTLTTPTLFDGVVYTVNRHGRAFALELESGAPLWDRDYQAELELEETFHGFCASPVVLGDRIVYVFGGTAVVARRDGGEVLWRTEDHGDGAYTNPTVFELRGRTLVAVMLGQTLFVFELESGEVVYEFAWPLKGSAVHVAQPLVIGDRMLISTAYGKGAAMLRLLDSTEPEVLWTSRRLRSKVTGLYLYAGHVYGFDESMLKCFDLEGNERWHVRGLGMGSLSIAGDRLLVLSSSGELIVAEATPEEFRELSRRQVLDGGSYWTMPVFVGGAIYVRNSLGDLKCLDHRGGEPAAKADEPVLLPAPAAAELFAAHAEASGGALFRTTDGLRLSGEWEILGRGMSRTPSSLSLGAPNRWRLGLDSGQLVHTFDGELGWELKNGAFRLFDESEAVDAPRALALAELFAPECPPDATVAPRPVAFGGTNCWQVVSAVPADVEGEGARRSVRHYFDVSTGRLVGREGDELSTTIYQGAIAIGDAHVPERIVIYRTGSGQEEVFYVSRGEWIEPDTTLFARPPGLSRLLRTPEQRAADSRVLRERYARELGQYDYVEGPGPPEGMVIDVEDGDLVLIGGEDRIVLLPDPVDEAKLLLGGMSATLEFLRDEDGAVTGARISFSGESVLFSRGN